MQLLTSQEPLKPAQSIMSADDVITIADMEGENLDMTVCQINQALNFAIFHGLETDETAILNSIKQAHQAMNSNPEGLL